eukprot:scaffold115_cov304-Prasinococcus_capsulatus_cf.AAC.63
MVVLSGGIIIPRRGCRPNWRRRGGRGWRPAAPPSRGSVQVQGWSLRGKGRPLHGSWPEELHVRPRGPTAAMQDTQEEDIGATAGAVSDVVKGIFGSDSEEEDDQEKDSPGKKTVQEADRADEDTLKPAETPQRKTVSRTFASDEEDEEDDEDTEYKKALPADAQDDLDAGEEAYPEDRKEKLKELTKKYGGAALGEDSDADDGAKQQEEEEEEEEEEPVEDLVFACEYEKPAHSMESVRLAKLSNIVGIEKEEFNPETFKAEEEAYLDEAGQVKVRLRDQNVIRWRKVDDGSGGYAMQSNARIVKWSDGSVQLLLGEETFNVDTQPIHKENHHLYTRKTPGVLQSQGHFLHRVTFRPTSLSSRSHQRLTKAIDKRHGKVNKIRKFVTGENPEEMKAAMEKEEMEKQRELLMDKEREMQERTRLRRSENERYERDNFYAQEEGRSAKGALSADFLEADEDEGYLPKGISALRRDLDPDEDRIRQAKRNFPPGKRLRQFEDNVADDAEGEDAGPDQSPAKTAPKKQKRAARLALSDSDDEI